MTEQSLTSYTKHRYNKIYLGKNKNQVIIMSADSDFHVYDLLNEMITNKVSGASIGYEQ